MFDMGTQELIVVLVIASLVLGVKKLPNLGKSLGEGFRVSKRVWRIGKVRDMKSNPPDKDGNKKH